MNMKVTCVVACANSNGEPDFYPCIVDCSQEQYDNGEHYDAAKDAAADAGYEPYLAYDHNDAGFAMLKLPWTSQLPVIAIPYCPA
jgi:hypothetical protein